MIEPWVRNIIIVKALFNTAINADDAEAGHVHHYKSHYIN